MPPAAPSTAPLGAPLLLHLDCCCFPGHRIAPAQAAAAAAASVRGALAAHPKAAEEGGTRGSGGVGGGRSGCVHRSWRFCMPQGHSTTASHSTRTSMSACQHMSDTRVAHTCVILLWHGWEHQQGGCEGGKMLLLPVTSSRRSVSQPLMCAEDQGTRKSQGHGLAGKEKGGKCKSHCMGRPTCSAAAPCGVCARNCWSAGVKVKPKRPELPLAKPWLACGWSCVVISRITPGVGTPKPSKFGARRPEGVLRALQVLDSYNILD